jgi:hypothetical protein
MAEKTAEKYAAHAVRIYECMDSYTVPTVYILIDGSLYLTRRGQYPTGFARRYLRLRCQSHRLLRIIRNQINQEVGYKDRKG